VTNALAHWMVVAMLAAADPQTPIAPVKIEPAIGGGNPVVVSVTGVEQDPVPLSAKWNPSEACFADVACFVSNWMEANSTGNMEHAVALRAANERADFQKRYADPQMMLRNAARFNQVRKWSLLGWAEYGSVRVVLLVKEDSTPDPIFTLTVRKVDGRWTQTDVLAADPGFREIFDRVGLAILERHHK
jgi:hypothetical protein